MTHFIIYLIQNFAVAAYIVVGSLENLINIFSAASWFWYGAAFLGLLIMRLTLPKKYRPFKVAKNIMNQRKKWKGLKGNQNGGQKEEILFHSFL